MTWDRDQIRLVSRWYALRKQGKLYPLIDSGEILFTFTDPCDPWGSRERLDWDVLGRDVEAAEMPKKQVQSERNHYTKEKRA